MVSLETRETSLLTPIHCTRSRFPITANNTPYCDCCYSNLAQGKNMDEDEELVQFYREVMARREEHGWDKG